MTDDQAIVNDYPRPISKWYAASLKSADAEASFSHLLNVVESTLRYLALVAWGEYRSGGVPNSKVEAVIGKVRRPAVGHWLELLRTISSEGKSGIAPRLDRKLSRADAPAVYALLDVWLVTQSGIEFGVRPEKLSEYVKKGLPGVKSDQGQKSNLDEFFGVSINIRNRLHGHSAELDLGAGQKYVLAILNAYLQPALREVLTLPRFKTALLDHVWANPEQEAKIVFDDADGIYEICMVAQTSNPLETMISVRSLTPQIRRGTLIRLADSEPMWAFDYDQGWPVVWPPVVTASRAETGPVPFAELVAAAVELGPLTVEGGEILRRQGRRLGLPERDIESAIAAAPAVAPQVQKVARGAVVEDAVAPEIVVPTLPPAVSPEELRTPSASADESVLAAGAEATTALPTPSGVDPEAQGPQDPGVREDPDEAADGQWDERKYFNDLRSRTKPVPEGLIALHHAIYQAAARLVQRGCLTLEWGRGRSTGSFTLKSARVSLMTPFSNGHIWLNIGMWNSLPDGERQWLHAAACAVLCLPATHPKVAVLGQAKGAFPNVADDLLLADPEATALAAWLEAAGQHTGAPGESGDPELATSAAADGAPTVWWVNVGGRDWEDERTLGFWSCGGSVQFRIAAQRFRPGDVLYAYISKRGYVGSGRVRECAARLEARLAPATASNTKLSPRTEDYVAANTGRADDDAEWAVGVDWASTVPEHKALPKGNLFHYLRTCCRLTDVSTLTKLREVFPLPASGDDVLNASPAPTDPP